MMITVMPYDALGQRTLPTGEHQYDCTYIIGENPGLVMGAYPATIGPDGSISCGNDQPVSSIIIRLDGAIFRIYDFKGKRK
jgi:hypothetical protein